MIIEDRIWGKFEVNEPVILELLNLCEIKRLEGISQFGLPYEYYGLKGFSRAEHSIGTMLLLRKLGAGLEEQVAGLTHDISHTAFSHLVDWVIGDRKNEDYQDNRHGEIMLNGNISNVLKKYKFSPERLAEHDNYTLLEMPSPNLCADRIDYAMREFQDWACPEIVEECKNRLMNKRGKIVFKEKQTAKKFALGFLKLQREHWGAAEYMLRWQRFAEILRYAMEKKYIEISDFDSTDTEVIGKLQDSKDEFIIGRLQELRGELKCEVVDINSDYFLKKKFRHIDPLYLEDERVARLSETDRDFCQFLEKEREHNANGIRIRMLNL